MWAECLFVGGLLLVGLVWGCLGVGVHRSNGNLSGSVVDFSYSHLSLVHVNERTYRIPNARRITVNEGQICVDGLPWTENQPLLRASQKDFQIARKIELHIHPPSPHHGVPNVTAHVGTIQVHGSANEVSTDSGDIHVRGNVYGNARTDVGNIQIEGELRGSAKTDVGDIISRRKKSAL